MILRKVEEQLLKYILVSSLHVLMDGQESWYNLAVLCVLKQGGGGGGGLWDGI